MVNKKEEKNFLTTAEVAERLNVTPNTIYKYVREKKLVPLYDHKWRMRRTKVFAVEEVEKLEKKFMKPGLTTGEVADKLGIHITTINAYIHDNVLKAEKQLYRGREIYFIAPEEVERWQREHHVVADQKVDRKDFYIKDKGLLLFQLFVNKYTHEHARLMTIKGSTGKIITENGEEYSLEVGTSRGFEPYQIIDNKEYNTKRGYVKFKFPRPHSIKSDVYAAIELVYIATGPQNIRYNIDAQYIEMEVKPVLIKSKDKQLLDLFQKHLLEGKILIQQDGFYIDSDLETLIITVPSQLKEYIRKRAKKENKSMEQLSIEAFNTAWNLNEDTEEKGDI
ncbi:helix-turn-helix domain-containing protein [Sutcliffiella horikoshii]|uniref:helix-turn-helix domain-containing protein n=1 Tax=Sutcliffiella horikoshii TaxID=79883 RepID=UPI00203ED3F9|nr:helix-turn-helix domain-containing protein [Sutcliffiella horikoshii]MCM3619816.1 helix-turn-helix domain-containing protein [Sutcliffiella horikoshii]